MKVYSRKGQHEAADFLIKCLEFFPYRIHRILTDNSREFSLNKLRNRFGQTKQEVLFDLICEWLEISHKTTRVKHPWINDQVESMIKIVKNQTVKIYRYQTPEEAARDLKRYKIPIIITGD